MLDIKPDLVHLVRLALEEKTDDVRLYVARLVRRYRASEPELSEQLEGWLKSQPARSASFLRKAAPADKPYESSLPVDHETRLSLLKKFQPSENQVVPLWSKNIEDTLSQLIKERKNARILEEAGLSPSRSAIFTGPPGVGKTLTARWLASQLKVPLYILDLTAVMSSLLGKSGNNIRAALDYAKKTPCVLLLDEIDAIAKKRGDEGDIGELKRLVTVILQEVDDWPSSSLLLAATNHPELIDPALWRRFDMVVEFELPEEDPIRKSISIFLGPDQKKFEKWTNVLSFALRGNSFSVIEREILHLRRALVLGTGSEEGLICNLLDRYCRSLNKKDNKDLALKLCMDFSLSQHLSSKITGVSRETIRTMIKSQKTHSEIGEI